MTQTRDLPLTGISLHGAKFFGERKASISWHHREYVIQHQQSATQRRYSIIPWHSSGLSLGEGHYQIENE
jgi:hypothetical protein